MIDVAKIEKIIGYKFKNPEILKTAFVHSSYSYISNERNNQRLEFLGDSVLSLVVTEFLVENYPDCPEGRLTQMRQKLVAEAPLSDATSRLKLEDYLLLGCGEIKQNIRSLDSIKADLFEAVVGAIYGDSESLELCKEFVISALSCDIENIGKNGDIEIDAKSKINEYALKYAYPLEYVLKKKTGPDHNPKYTFEVVLNNKVVGSGQGTSKRDAQQNAAKKALKNLKIT